jgi:hypothetical protein
MQAVMGIGTAHRAGRRRNVGLALVEHTDLPIRRGGATADYDSLNSVTPLGDNNCKTSFDQIEKFSFLRSVGFREPVRPEALRPHDP